MKSTGALVAASLALLALAGCTKSSAEGFDIKAPSTSGGAYTFTASGSADNYTWDLGDHLTFAYGKKVTHTYDFTDGTITVTLRTKTGTKSSEHSQQLILGTGKNSPSVFFLEAQTNWTVTGENVRFSAEASKDPENDALRFSWSCLRTKDAVRQPPHTHAPLPGIDFASAPAGSVTSGPATRELPPSKMRYEGDLCDALGSGTAASTDSSSIEGTFAKTGIYDIFLLASDPVHPTVSGQFRIYVTTPGERPPPVVSFDFSGTMKGGPGAPSIQQVCTQANQGECDYFEGTFQLPLAARWGLLNLTYDGGTGGANKIRVEVGQSTKVVASSGACSATAPGSFPLDPKLLPSALYTVKVQLCQGAQVSWTVRVMAGLDRDPAKVY